MLASHTFKAMHSEISFSSHLLIPRCFSHVFSGRLSILICFKFLALIFPFLLFPFGGTLKHTLCLYVCSTLNYYDVQKAGISCKSLCDQCIKLRAGVCVSVVRWTTTTFRRWTFAASRSVISGTSLPSLPPSDERNWRCVCALCWSRCLLQLIN